MSQVRRALGAVVAAAAAGLVMGAPAAAQRYQASDEDVASNVSALEILDFVLEQRIGIEDSLVSVQPYDIPGSLFVRMPGDSRWNPYTILSDAQRAQGVAVTVLDPTQGNYVDLVFAESNEVSSESPLGALAGLLGVGFSESYRTHFTFEPVLSARGPSYGPGNPELMAQINQFAELFQSAGFETYYVNSVDVYRSRNERFVAASRQLNAGFALVSGGRVYTREANQTRQRVHYVLNASKVVPSLTAEVPSPVGPASSRTFGGAGASRSMGAEVSDAELQSRFEQAAALVAAQGGERDRDLEAALAAALKGD